MWPMVTIDWHTDSTSFPLGCHSILCFPMVFLNPWGSGLSLILPIFARYIYSESSYLFHILLQGNLLPVSPTYFPMISPEQQLGSAFPNLLKQHDKSHEESSLRSRLRVMTPEILEKIASYLLENPTLFAWELRQKLIAESEFINWP